MAGKLKPRDQDFGWWLPKPGEGKQACVCERCWEQTVAAKPYAHWNVEKQRWDTDWEGFGDATEFFCWSCGWEDCKMIPADEAGLHKV